MSAMERVQAKEWRELTSQLSSVVSSLSIASERSLRTLPVKSQYINRVILQVVRELLTHISWMCAGHHPHSHHHHQISHANTLTSKSNVCGVTCACEKG